MSARRHATADRASRMRRRPADGSAPQADPAGGAGGAGGAAEGSGQGLGAPAGQPSGTAAAAARLARVPARLRPAGAAGARGGAGSPAAHADNAPPAGDRAAAPAAPVPGTAARRSAGAATPGRKRLPTRVPASHRGRGQAGAGPRLPAGDPPAADRAPGSARSGRDGFSEKLLADAEAVLARVGERMRLSSDHTVVVLAGGTGSGKSSLFNRLVGADLSTVGVTRPVTRDAHACVWGQAGSGAIMDWLDVPARYRYSRASALDSGEDDLAGLVLLDLPDHDSVMSHSGELVDQLVSMADVMVWVLDPQKYADAAVHRRFLVPLASHSDVLAVVLNQSDVLDPAQVDDCVADLRRLLESENLQDVPVLVTSAVSGAGLGELRKLLADGVAAGRAATARISADVDDVVTRFEPYAGDVDAPVGGVPAPSKAELADQFAAAAGVSAICDALRSARELRAVDFVGWPVAWFVQRVTGRDPIRKVRLGMLWNDLRSVTAGPAGAQQAEIDNALTELGSELAEPLPTPWSGSMTSVLRSRADDIPAAVGSAIGDALPAEDSVVWWWRLAGLWQGLLLGTAAVGLAWLVLIVIFGVFHAAAGMPALLSKPGVMSWVAAGAVVVLALGATTSWVCLRLVRTAAEQENVRVVADMRDRIAAVADEMVIMPAEQELAELARYREEARIAARGVVADQVG